MFDNSEARGHSCCSPQRRSDHREPLPGTKSERNGSTQLHARGEPIPGGLAYLGTRFPVHAADGEGPLRRVEVAPFRMEATTVTNRQFQQFVAYTGYITEAERFGWSFVFVLQIDRSVTRTRGVLNLEWWRQVEGACWRAPEGPRSTVEDRLDHPVVHVSWNDARAYAEWAAGRLPSEIEWEHAARGGLGDVPYPWGERPPEEDGFTPCNIWQGEFPHRNTAADGFVATAPVRSFAPNGYGLYNMVGNVWEWTADPFSAPDTGFDSAAADRRLLKGGSFLCHQSYCHRYRIAARTGNTPDSTTSHQGFRIVYDDLDPGHRHTHS